MVITLFCRSDHSIPADGRADAGHSRTDISGFHLTHIGTAVTGNGVSVITLLAKIDAAIATGVRAL